VSAESRLRDVVDAEEQTPQGGPSQLVVRPTGQELFDSLSKAEQDEMLGPEAAEKVRQGEATLADFVQYDGNFITQKPVEDV
jgi:hypothetical protein